MKSVDRIKAYQFLARMIDAYVQARCPIIAFLKNKVLNGQTIDESHDSSENHSIVIVGVRRSLRTRAKSSLLKGLSPTEVIYHDPSSSPFRVVSIEKLFEAMQSATTTLGKVANKLSAVFTTPLTISVSVHECFQKLEKHCDHFYEKFVIPRVTESVDYEIRLMHSDDLGKYLSQRTPYGVKKLIRRCSRGELFEDNGKLNGWLWVFVGYQDSIPMECVLFGTQLIENRVQYELCTVLTNTPPS